MRIVFIGKSHEFSLIPLHELMAMHEIVGIIESGPRSSLVERKSLLRRFALSSTLLLKLVSMLRSRSLFRRAWKLRVPYLYLTSANRTELAKFVTSIAPDILVVASLSQLLSKEVIGIPRFGAINLHPSLLPKYHGPFPWFWQYHAMEENCGVTVHAIDEGQDTGPILGQESISIPRGTDIQTAIRTGSKIGARLLLRIIEGVETGTVRALKQSPHNFPKARVISRDEQFIDWNEWDIERVWHFMRGTYPWHDAVVYPRKFLGKWRIGDIERSAVFDAPGTVCQDQHGYYIAHHQGKIRLYFERPWQQAARAVVQRFSSLRTR